MLPCSFSKNCNNQTNATNYHTNEQDQFPGRPCSIHITDIYPYPSKVHRSSARVSIHALIAIRNPLISIIVNCSYSIFTFLSPRLFSEDECLFNILYLFNCTILLNRVLVGNYIILITINL